MVICVFLSALVWPVWDSDRVGMSPFIHGSGIQWQAKRLEHPAGEDGGLQSPVLRTNMHRERGRGATPASQTSGF